MFKKFQKFQKNPEIFFKKFAKIYLKSREKYGQKDEANDLFDRIRLLSTDSA